MECRATCATGFSPLTGILCFRRIFAVIVLVVVMFSFQSPDGDSLFSELAEAGDPGSCSKEFQSPDGDSLFSEKVAEDAMEVFKRMVSVP